MSTSETEILNEVNLRPGLLQERRAARMRLGQAVCEIFPLLSDPDVRVALVALSEAEYERTLSIAAQMPTEDNVAGAQLRDRAQTLETLAFAIRDPKDLTKRVYNDGREVALDLQIEDVNYLIDHYFEMADRNSPRVEFLPEEQVEQLKKALQEMDWNALDGKQWYAAKRFLLSLMPQPLADSLLGSG